MKMTLKRQLTKYSLILLPFLTIMVLTGCGTVQHKVTFQDNYSPQAQTKIEVGQVTNQTIQTFDVDIEQLLREALAEALQKEALLWDGSTGDRLILNSKIIEYDKGNAFMRWLVPGAGSTALVIRCDLKEGDKVVGSAEAKRTVDAGGLYTLGAWKTIFGSVARDVVNDMRSQIKK
jgi:hypothetical protein